MLADDCSNLAVVNLDKILEVLMTKPHYLPVIFFLGIELVSNTWGLIIP